MPAPITVVIPTLNAAHGLPGVANALAEGLDAGLIRQLVISDGGSSDATLNIADELGAKVVTGAPSRGGQIRRGAETVKNGWLLIVHADTELAPGWSDAVRSHLGVPDKAGYFRLSFREAGMLPKLVSGWANTRSRLFGLPYGDQALLIHSDLLAEVGGVPDIPLMEDVALARTLKGRLVMLPSYAATSAARYRRDGWVRRSVLNLWTLMRYLAGVPPERLAAQYHRGKT